MMKNFLLVSLVLFLSIQISAQAPGGVDGGVTNQMWLDANQLTLNNGDPVATWTDASTAGNDASIAFPVRRPTFNTSQINGLPSVVFDGSDFIQTGAIAAMNVGTISQFVVFDGSPADHNGVMLAAKYVEHSQFIMNYRANSNIRTWVIEPPNTTNGNITSVNSAYQVLGGIWDAGTGDVTNYKNGTSFGTDNGANTVPTGNSYYRIGANSAGASYFFNGGIAEVILYSSALNSAERNIVTNYIGAKYNLTIANDYFSYQATHGRELVGVGQEADGNNNTAIGTSIFRMSNPTTLANTEYILVGHDGVALTPGNTVDVPVVGNVRFGRVWRTDIQGGTEIVDITFDLSTFSLGAPAGHKLLVDNDGVFSDATPIIGVYDVPTQTVTFSGVSLTAGDFITLMNDAVAIQSTGVTTDWHTTTTWDCGCIPGLGSQVTILAGHTVDINGTDALVGNLTIDATGALTFSGGDKLTLDESFNNNGSVTAGSGEFNFTSTVAQTISGTISFYDLTINNTLGVTVSSGSTGIQGLLDVTLGTLTTGGLVTMLSNSAGSGAIKNPATGIIAGDLTVQRYVNEVNKWYLLASPLTDADIEDWNQEFEMQGFPGTEWFPAGGSVFYYDETAIVSDWNDGFLMPSSTADIATNGVGWDAYIDDDGIATGPRSIDLTGTPRLGDGITLNGTNSNTLADPDENGWNLFANPYAAPFTWGNVAKSNVIAGYRKGSTGSFAALNNGSTIASGEGFWVQVNIGGGSMTFDANDVTGTNADTYNQKLTGSFTDGDVTYFNLKLIFDSGSEDLIEIGFAPNATDNLDIGKDAIKLNSSNYYNPNLSIEIANRHYARNIFNQNVNNLEIPLNIFTETPISVSDNYNLVFEGMDDLLKSNKHFQLEDRTLGVFYNILSDTVFSVSMFDTVTATRFFLQVNEPINIVSINDVSCAGNGDGKIVVNGNGVGPYTYIWKNVIGTVLKTTTNQLGSDSLDLLSGNTYSVEVLNNGIYGSTIYEFTINEPVPVISSFSSNEDNNLINWVYSNLSDTMQVEVNQMISFFNESEGAISYDWNFGDLTFSNLGNPSKFYSAQGIYKVELVAENGVCAVTSEQYVSVNWPTSIDETNLLNDINVIVNENGILVSLNNENSKDVTFSIVNNLGQNVFTKDINAEINHQERIYLNNAQGVYLITVKDSRSTKTKKFVLSKK